jgi:Tol biopolymer transport system component
MIHQKFILVIFILLLGMVACSPFGGIITADISQSEVSTAVAATVEALKIEESGGEQTSLLAETTQKGSTPLPSENSSTHPPHPSNLKIVFNQSGDAWIWEEGIGKQQLTDFGNVIDVGISEDGEIVIFILEFDNFYHELWAVNNDGTNQRQLISRSSFEEIPRPEDFFITTQLYDYNWVPDSHELVFSTKPVAEGPGDVSNNDLYSINTKTGELKRLLEPGLGGQVYFSPDGKQIALVTQDKISIISADGTNRREALAFPFVYTYSEWVYYPTPVWSMDSKYLRVAIPPQDSLGDPSAPTILHEIDAAAASSQVLAEFVGAPVFQGSPLISPDALKILYVRPLSNNTPDSELHHLEISSMQDTVYTEDAFLISSWSPDSYRFTYSPSNAQQVFLGKIGTDPVNATDHAYVIDLRWIDENRIVFSTGSSDNGGFSLHWGIAGGTSKVISDQFDRPPHFDFAP